MSEFGKLQRAVRVYVAFVVLVGGWTVGHSIFNLIVDPIGPQWILLAGLTILTGSFSVKVPTLNAYLSVSEAFVFASVLLFGASAGTVTVLLECLVILLWMQPQGRPLHRIFFNMAAPSVALWTSATAYYLVFKIEPYSHGVTPLARLFVPLLAFTVLYFLLNSWLVALAVGLEDRRSPVEIWWKNFAWLSVNYFSGASLAALIVTYTGDIQLSTVAVIVPLLLVSYLTFRTAMGRAEDSYSHLAALNRLYFSTIETLAMAIDAKDQITHGHIRRVQAYAVGLAKHIGVSDANLLSAIEAAALLHDMGKLAVPEYILNKPGKLTQAEFEKMKLHAGVGADILSAIDFPYPVVPIVRHHHESWDGSGYPSGRRGTDIPIGARILSVVDCFDALTSDRPYRPRLSDEEAIKILLNRRGTMYDPLVVDTFLRVYRDIAPEQKISLPTNSALIEITSSTTTQRQPEPTTMAAPTPADGMLALYEVSARLRDRVGIADTTELISKHLRSVVPFALFVLYMYEEATDQLVAKYAVGDVAQSVQGLRFPLGERLSGWVAANRQTIVNSDPALDLAGLAASGQQPLRSCLSTPLCTDDALVGVMAVYSTVSESFTPDHRRICEALAAHSSATFKKASAFDESSKPDDVTGLHTSIRLRYLLSDIVVNGTSKEQEFALLTVTIDNLERTAETFGRSVGDRLVRHVAAHTQAALRATDLLFRCSESTLVALLLPADPLSAEAIAMRVRENIWSEPLTAHGIPSLLADVTVTVKKDSTPFEIPALHL